MVGNHSFRYVGTSKSENRNGPKLHTCTSWGRFRGALSSTIWFAPGRPKTGPNSIAELTPLRHHFNLDSKCHLLHQTQSLACISTRIWLLRFQGPRVCVRYRSCSFPEKSRSSGLSRPKKFARIRHLSRILDASFVPC